MSLTRTLQLGAKISRAEWTRHRRERGTPLTGNLVLLVILVGIAIGLGWLAYSVGRTVASGQKLPLQSAKSVCECCFCLDDVAEFPVHTFGSNGLTPICC